MADDKDLTPVPSPPDRRADEPVSRPHESGSVQSGWLTLAAMGIVAADIFLFVRKLESLPGFGGHLIFLGGIGFCLGLGVVYLLAGRRWAKGRPTGPIPLDRQWAWRVPLGLVLGEVAWAAASFVVGANYDKFSPPPAQLALRVGDVTYFDLPSAEFVRWSNRRWYVELSTGAVAGGLAAALILTTGIRLRTLAAAGIVLGTLGGGGALWRHATRYDRAFAILEQGGSPAERFGALERIGQQADDPRALPALIRACDDPDSVVAGQAVTIIGAMGPRAAEAVPTLFDRLRAGKLSPNPKDVVDVLAKLGEPGIQALANILRSRGNLHLDFVKPDAVAALRNLGPAARPAFPALVQSLSDSTRATHSSTVLGNERTIGQEAAEVLGLAGPEGITLLVSALSAPERGVRMRAADALSHASTTLSEIAQILVALNLIDFRADSFDVAEPRYVATYRGLLDRLRRLGPEAAPALPTLLDDLTNQNYRIYKVRAEIETYIQSLGAAVLPTIAQLYEAGMFEYRGDAEKEMLLLVRSLFEAPLPTLAEPDRLLVELILLGEDKYDPKRVEQYRAVLGRLRALGPPSEAAIIILLRQATSFPLREAQPEAREAILAAGAKARPVLLRAQGMYDTDLKAFTTDLLNRLPAAGK